MVSGHSIAGHKAGSEQREERAHCDRWSTKLRPKTQDTELSTTQKWEKHKCGKHVCGELCGGLQIQSARRYTEGAAKGVRG